MSNILFEKIRYDGLRYADLSAEMQVVNNNKEPENEIH